MRCKYVERDLDGKIVGSKIGIVDVKGYKGKEKIYGYFEFENEMKYDDDDKIEEGYNLKDINCEEVIMKRKDMSLLNPIRIKDEDNYDGEYHRLKWCNYVEILSEYIDNIVSNEASFVCYNENDSSNKLIKLYNGVSAEMLFNDIIFVFNKR